MARCYVAVHLRWAPPARKKRSHARRGGRARSSTRERWSRRVAPPRLGVTSRCAGTPARAPAAASGRFLSRHEKNERQGAKAAKSAKKRESNAETQRPQREEGREEVLATDEHRWTRMKTGEIGLASLPPLAIPVHPCPICGQISFSSLQPPRPRRLCVQILFSSPWRSWRPWRAWRSIPRLRSGVPPGIPRGRRAGK